MSSPYPARWARLGIAFAITCDLVLIGAYLDIPELVALNLVIVPALGWHWYRLDKRRRRDD